MKIATIIVTYNTMYQNSIAYQSLSKQNIDIYILKGYEDNAVCGVRQ